MLDLYKNTSIFIFPSYFFLFVSLKRMIFFWCRLLIKAMKASQSCLFLTFFFCLAMEIKHDCCSY